jgi:hypothetical protein
MAWVIPAAYSGCEATNRGDRKTTWFAHWRFLGVK